MSIPVASQERVLRAWWGRFDQTNWPIVDFAIAVVAAIPLLPFMLHGAPRHEGAFWFLAFVIVGALTLRRVATEIAFWVVVLAPLTVRLIWFGLERDPTNTMYLGRWPGHTYRLDMITPWVAYIALATILYTCASRWRLRRTLPHVVVAAAVTVGSAVLFVPRLDRPGELLTALMAQLAATLVGFQIGTGGERARFFAQRASQLALERDQREQLAVSQERTRIAREMHDVVAHSLTVMVTLADGAVVALDRNPGAARRAMQEVSGAGRSALGETRRIVGVLRHENTAPPLLPGSADGPTPLVPQPGREDVRSLVERFRAVGMEVEFEEIGGPLPPDAGLNLAVYRIVQESLTNVLRYAATTPRICVRLVRGPRRVTIEVENDHAPDFVAARGSGKGLIGMRERAAVYGGTAHAGPTPTGWRVAAVLYW